MNSLRQLLPVFVLVACAPMFGCAKQLEARRSSPRAPISRSTAPIAGSPTTSVLIQAGSGDPNIRTIENEQRIRAAVDRTLAAKGLEKAEDDEAQLVIAFHGGRQASLQDHGRRRARSRHPRRRRLRDARHVDAVHVRSRHQKQIWSAWTKKDLERGTDPDTVVNEAVGVLLNEFPP